MKTIGPVLSIVDYDAWNKGYMPPTEHILIDKLSYRGARVVLSTALGGDAQLWVVLEGKKPLSKAQRKFLRDMVALWFDDETSIEQPVDEPGQAPEESNSDAP